MELKNAGRLDDAERAFTELVAAFPDYVPAYLHAGNVLAAQGKKAEASETFRSGIAACGRKRDAHAQGELEAALTALETAEAP